MRERDRECYLHQQSTEDSLVHFAEAGQGGLSSAGEALSRAYVELKEILAFTAICLTCRPVGGAAKKNVLEQLVLQQAAEKLTASEGRMGSGR